jgi:hypothetical protein
VDRDLLDIHLAEGLFPLHIDDLDGPGYNSSLDKLRPCPDDGQDLHGISGFKSLLTISLPANTNLPQSRTGIKMYCRNLTASQKMKYLVDDFSLFLLLQVIIKGEPEQATAHRFGHGKLTFTIPH